MSNEYLELQRSLHACGNYGISGHKWAETANNLATLYDAKTLLDYGCGQGTLGRALKLLHARDIRHDDSGRSLAAPVPPYEVLEYDPAIPGKDVSHGRADIVVCGDVLEHIEPDFLDDVLDAIMMTAQKAVLFVVSTRPAVKTLADGRNAHLIIKPTEWWLPKLLSRWKIVESKNFRSEFVFVGEPK